MMILTSVDGNLRGAIANSYRLHIGIRVAYPKVVSFLDATPAIAWYVMQWIMGELASKQWIHFNLVELTIPYKKLAMTNVL